MTGSRKLGDWPLDTIEVRCRLCKRFGRLRTAALVAKHGRHLRLPDLRNRIAAEGGCQNVKNQYHGRCDVYYPQLADRP